LDFGLHEDADEPSGVDDLFVVRRVSSGDCDINAGEEADGVDRLETTGLGDEGMRGTRRRVVTRAAIARKILKKKIQVNTKGRFDDEDVSAGAGASNDGSLDTGQVHTRIGDSVGEDKAGIDIALAERELRAADERDRREFSRRVNMKHKERRQKRKLKEATTKGRRLPDRFSADADGDTVAVLGGSDDDASVDLSWLPDPDAVKDADGEAGTEASASSSKLASSAKRQRREAKAISLAEQEALALKLISL